MPDTKRISLALQGGGAHGAYAWGVLDRFLEEPKLEIEALVGTSAGAMNAVVTANGLQRGGATAARELLERFWKRISEAGTFSMLQPSLLDKLVSKGGMEYSPSYHTFNWLTELFSPYELNPLNINPLRDVLTEMIDFDQVRRCTRIKVFVCATNVRTIAQKVFEWHELTPDMVMASACLPFLFHTVEIYGEAYWDGGYMGNPPLSPIIERTRTTDVVIVKINPIYSPHIPKTAHDIKDRVNEISFNSSLLWEMRYIELKNSLVAEGLTITKHPQWRQVFLHAISADDALIEFGYSSKLNTTWEFLVQLKEIGRQTADAWLNRHYDDLNRCCTYDFTLKPE
jgi:NTE family protein